MIYFCLNRLFAKLEMRSSLCVKVGTYLLHFVGCLVIPGSNSCKCSCGRGNSLKDPASKAYGQVFAPHHVWAIRKAVAAGMYALPTKSQLLRKLNEDGES